MPLHPRLSNSQIAAESSPSTTTGDSHTRSVTAGGIEIEDSHGTARDLGVYPQKIHLEDSHPPVHIPSLDEGPHRGDSIIPCLNAECTLHPRVRCIVITMADATSRINIDLGHMTHDVPEMNSEIQIPPPSPLLSRSIAAMLRRQEHVNLLTSLKLYVRKQERHERIVLGIGAGVEVHDVEISSVDAMYVRKSKNPSTRLSLTYTCQPLVDMKGLLIYLPSSLSNLP